MPELNPSPLTQSGNQDGGRETPVVVNTEPTPLDPSPDFPVTAKPRLSPNPKSSLEYKDGGRGTPVIVVNPPRPAIDPTEESAEIEALKAYVDEKLAEKENLSNKVTSIGETASNTNYPSEKAVKDYVQAVVLGAIEEAY